MSKALKNLPQFGSSAQSASHTGRFLRQAGDISTLLGWLCGGALAAPRTQGRANQAERASGKARQTDPSGPRPPEK